jgi:DNA topoisomerase-1
MLDPQNAAADPVLSAKAAQLRYVSDRTPGIRRVRTGRSFRYIDSNGRVIRNRDILRRIQSLAIPPAWKDVWIAPSDNAHLQAVGRDARHRKQYRYHPRWREVRDETKYHRMIGFGKVLPRIRSRVSEDLRTTAVTREKVLATVVRLLETTHIRVGNEEYTKQNSSFGLTTLRDHHVHIHGPRIDFYFRGKSGVKHAISVQDAALARIVRQCRDLPGYELFQYVDSDGNPQTIDSADVNEYIREISGDDFSAKDFRTWAGTVLAAATLSRLTAFKTNAQAKKNLVKAIESVATDLGNTIAVCRKCYIHPAVIESYLDRSLPSGLKATGSKRHLRAEEAAVLSFLRNRVKKTSAAKTKTQTLEEKLKRSIRKTRRASKIKRHEKS